jgi:hypothetical protein
MLCTAFRDGRCAGAGDDAWWFCPHFASMIKDQGPRLTRRSGECEETRSKYVRRRLVGFVVNLWAASPLRSARGQRQDREIGISFFLYFFFPRQKYRKRGCLLLPCLVFVYFFLPCLVCLVLFVLSSRREREREREGERGTYLRVSTQE